MKKIMALLVVLLGVEAISYAQGAVTLQIPQSYIASLQAPYTRGSQGGGGICCGTEKESRCYYDYKITGNQVTVPLHNSSYLWLGIFSIPYSSYQNENRGRFPVTAGHVYDIQAAPAPKQIPAAPKQAAPSGYKRADGFLGNIFYKDITPSK